MSSTRWLYARGLGSVALGGASLLVPLYVVALGADPFVLGVLGASAALLGAPGAILFGRLADRTGRRRTFVVGALVVATAVLLAVPALSSVAAVVVANAVLWVAVAAAGPVLNLLVVVDAPVAEWQRHVARLNTYQGWGWAGGLVLGTVWTAAAGRLAVPQRAFFLACAACAGVAALATVRWLPADGAAADLDPRRLSRAIARARRRNVRGATVPFAPGRLYWTTRSLHPRAFLRRFTPRLALYFLGAALFFVGFSAFFAPLPVFLTGAGFGVGEIFGLYLLSSLGAAAFYAGAGELAGRYDVTVLQAGSLAVRGVALPAVALVGGLLGGWLGGVDFTLAFGVAGGFVLAGAAVVLAVRRVAPADGDRVAETGAPGTATAAGQPSGPASSRRS